MKESHTAENLRNMIKIMVDPLEFDKAKIRSIVTDEGSNFLRLFKQYVNENEKVNLYIEASESSTNDQSANQQTSDEPEAVDIERDTLNNDNDDDDELSDSDEPNECPSMTFLDTDKYTVADYQECREIQFETPLSLSTELQTFMQNVEFNEAIEYQVVYQPLDTLELEIGSTNVPRFSCAAHKMIK